MCIRDRKNIKHLQRANSKSSEKNKKVVGDMGSYVPGTEQERTEMLREIGFESIEQLFAHIPEEVKVKDGLQIPEGMSEFEVRKTMQKMCIRDSCS